MYIILIFIYVLLNMLFSTGVHPPYTRWSDSILKFLREEGVDDASLARVRVPIGLDLGARSAPEIAHVRPLASGPSQHPP